MKKAQQQEATALPEAVQALVISLQAQRKFNQEQERHAEAALYLSKGLKLHRRPSSGWPPAETGRGAPVGSARGGHGEAGMASAWLPAMALAFHEAAEAKLQQDEADERKKRKQQAECAFPKQSLQCILAESVRGSCQADGRSSKASCRAEGQAESKRSRNPALGTQLLMQALQKQEEAKKAPAPPQCPFQMRCPSLLSSTISLKHLSVFCKHDHRTLP